MRELGGSIIKPLRDIFTKSLENSEVPQDWRVANITPIFKKGSKKEPGNYRPVSLTSQISKVMEKLIKSEIVLYLERYQLIKNSQHGFRAKRSCLTNLLEFLNIVSGHVDDGSPVDVIYLDFQKAFDKVPHVRLMKKLEAHGITGHLSRWIGAWLEGRKQRVVLNGECSNWEGVTSGVPQGSVLGPILFIIYLNDFDDNINNRIFKFADDAKIVGKVATGEEIQSMRDDLVVLDKWAEDWQMSFNVAKCKVVSFGFNNSTAKYNIGGGSLVSEREEKDLGVIIRDDLKNGKQCSQAATRGNQVLGMINRTFNCKNKVIMLKLYKSLVRPHLEFCVQAWRPHLKGDIDVIEKVQRRATKMIEGCKNLSYEERLRVLGLTTLETRRLRADLIEVFKIMRGLEGINAGMFTLREGVVRGHALKLFKNRVRLDVGKYSFKNRVCDEWNCLPEGVVDACSVNVFKGKLDLYLRCIRGFK